MRSSVGYVHFVGCGELLRTKWGQQPHLPELASNAALFQPSVFVLISF